MERSPNYKTVLIADLKPEARYIYARLISEGKHHIKAGASIGLAKGARNIYVKFGCDKSPMRKLKN
jgi:hypothetical protein